jgi:hypothetical protein
MYDKLAFKRVMLKESAISTRQVRRIIMGIFDKILKGLGLKKDEEPKAGATAQPRAKITFGKRPEMEMVDVVAKLDGLAKSNPQKLDWKVSIVDLLKLLDIDSSFENRKALATELGATADTMEDSARMNIWLHKEVLKRIAENGGNVPLNLLD